MMRPTRNQYFGLLIVFMGLIACIPAAVIALLETKHINVWWSSLAGLIAITVGVSMVLAGFLGRNGTGSP